jgi:hypothetical protein
VSSRIVQFPIRVVEKEDWIPLCFVAETHRVVAFDCRMTNEYKTFAGGHRVRLVTLKGNVHLKLPVTADIREVAPAADPKRRR